MVWMLIFSGLDMRIYHRNFDWLLLTKLSLSVYPGESDDMLKEGLLIRVVEDTWLLLGMIKEDRKIV